MESFLPDSVKAILLGVIAVAFVLSRLSIRLPHVGWLQYFRLPEIPMSEEKRERRRRSGNRMAGLEMVGAGLVLPLLYLASTVMMFNEPGTFGMIIVGAISIACIAVGIWIFLRNW